jgi:protoheme IX farnesyltransferase
MSPVEVASSAGKHTGGKDGAVDAAAVRPSRLRSRVGAYVALTKPRIIELLLITTIPVMFLAEGGIPDLWLVAATLVGGTLSAGSANTLNCYIDRDIDAVMHRTSKRPLVTGVITPRGALIFGLVLGVVSTVWLGLLVNWLSAALALLALLAYVVGYTLLL